MKNLTSLTLAGALAFGLANAAQAQSEAIPTPVNPHPVNPIATNGSPLPRSAAYDHDLQTGRSAYAGGPVGGLVGAGVGAADSLVGLGLNTAGSAVDTGLGVAGAATGAAVGTANDIVR